MAILSSLKTRSLTVLMVIGTTAFGMVSMAQEGRDMNAEFNSLPGQYSGTERSTGEDCSVSIIKNNSTYSVSLKSSSGSMAWQISQSDLANQFQTYEKWRQKNDRDFDPAVNGPELQIREASGKPNQFGIYPNQSLKALSWYSPGDVGAGQVLPLNSAAYSITTSTGSPFGEDTSTSINCYNLKKN